MLIKRKLDTVYEGMHDITADIKSIIEESGVKSGIAVVHCNHTTAGIIITSFWDKRGHVDFMKELDNIIPTRNDYLHQFDTPTDAAGHIKTGICGVSLSVIIENGKALLGSSQGILFAEFDGPRPREYFVKIMAD